MPFRTTTATALGALVTLLAAPALGAEDGDMPELRDGKWVSVTGEVAAKRGDEVMLDHGDGLLTIEMDDWIGPAGVSQLSLGDLVTVKGEVDADLYESRTIEASSVHNEATNSYYYAAPVDEEATPGVSHAVPTPGFTAPESTVTVAGTVTGVEGRTVMLDIGEATVEVDTAEMSYNPVDDVGYPQIGKGDRLQATGGLTAGFFEDGTVEAETVTLLTDTGMTG